MYNYSQNVGLFHQDIIIITDSEEETGNVLMEMGHWVTDVCYNRSEL